MKTASYSHSLHNLTAFSLIQEGDSYWGYSWKLPAGRVLSATVTLAAVAESLLASLATILFSPLYFIRRDSFHTIKGEAVDAAMLVGLSVKRFFGFETIEKPTATQPPMSANLPAKPASLPAKLASLPARPSSLHTKLVTLPAKPETSWQKALQCLKARASDVAHFAHERPKTTFFAITFGAAVVGAYYFGLFEHFPSLFPHSLPHDPRLKISSDILDQSFVSPISPRNWSSSSSMQTFQPTCPPRLMLSDKPFWSSPPRIPTFQPTCPPRLMLSDKPFWPSPPRIPTFQPLVLPKPTRPLREVLMLPPPPVSPSVSVPPNCSMISNLTVNHSSTFPSAKAFEVPNPMLSSENPGLSTWARMVENAKKVRDIYRAADARYQPVREVIAKMHIVTQPIAQWAFNLYVPILIVDLARGLL
ncbi:MAG: hypothetical protein KR126chlam3_00688 [Chlamydiae bacterium]|nr:hypothetical protein [Chlamydiota bacterium]